MIHGQEQFYERRKKPGRMGRDLPGLCLRGEKPTPGTSVKKALLEPLGRGRSSMFTQNPRMCTPSYMHGAIWKERGMSAAENKQVNRT